MKFQPATLLISCLLFTVVAKAQRDTTSYASDTIQYAKNNDRFLFHNKKLSSTKLEMMLSRYPSSALELKKYRNLALPATLVLLTGLTAGVIAFTRLNKDPGFFTPYSVTLFAGDLIGIPLATFAKKHLKRSVKLYNQEIRQ